MQDKAIRFNEWESVLRAEIPKAKQRVYREAIVKFRYWLRETGKEPVAEVFKEHLDWKKTYLSGEDLAIRQEALRWYYREGLSRHKASPTGASAGKPIQDNAKRPLKEFTRPKVVKVPRKAERLGDYRVYGMNDVPTAGARDLGGPPWEQALIRRIRERNLAWTSKNTYRSWCRRFIGACGNKPVKDLDSHDIRKWLSDLAVKDRVSVATQSQALNAVVFFSARF